MAATIIQSDSRIGIEKPFVVKAGPGAGKTHWLVEHIRNVLDNSRRLGHIRKIACITYTNIGVETIKDRLSVSADRVEVTTIHSFLYENVVGLYLYLIADDEGFAYNKFRVVDDTILVSPGVVYQLKRRTKRYNSIEDKKILEAISNAQWTLMPSGVVFKTRYPIKSGRYSVPNAILKEYKKYAWEHGVMHYDDVLYFAYKLIEKFPFIAQVIGAKYPYIFIDEFQDSTPLQVEILKKIALSSNTIVGVIGDVAQTIYGFAGANPSLLTEFKFPDMETYEIKGNRRSSKEIIELLNMIRGDLKQYPVEERSTERPILYEGNRVAAYAAFKRKCSGDVTTLSYANVTSNAFRKQVGTLTSESDLFKNINDSSSERVRALKDCLTAVELAMVGAMKDALKRIGKQFGQDQKKSIIALKKLIEDYFSYEDKEVTVFVNYLIENLNLSIPKLQRGKAKEFYNNILYKDLSLCISSPDVTQTKDKTIHKAKGDEYDNVMVILDDEKSLDFLLKPDLMGSEKEYQRVYYVACSRARNRLAISIPKMSDDAKKKLKDFPIDIVPVHI